MSAQVSLIKNLIYSKSKKRKREEDAEHMAFATWLRLNKIPFNHCPSGGKRPKKSINGKLVCIEGAKLKRMGAMRGFPDFFIMRPNRYHAGLFIEMKKREGGVTSKDQQDCMDLLIDQGYLAVVCEGWDEARELTKKYLSQPRFSRCLNFKF